MNNNSMSIYKAKKSTQERTDQLIDGLRKLCVEISDLLKPDQLYTDPVYIFNSLTNLKTFYPPDSFMNKLAGMVSDEALEIARTRSSIFLDEMQYALAKPPRTSTPDNK